MRLQRGFKIALQLIAVLSVVEALDRIIGAISAFAERLVAPQTAYTGTPGYWFWLLVPISIASIRLLIGVGLFLAARRIAAWYVPSAGLLCPGCMYDFTGLPPSGRCPECGATYNIAGR